MVHLHKDCHEYIAKARNMAEKLTGNNFVRILYNVSDTEYWPQGQALKQPLLGKIDSFFFLFYVFY